MLVAIRLSPLAKNVPQRNRCGYKFLHEPTVADVTKEQFAELKADSFLKVCNFPSVAWFQAFNIERTQVNEDLWRDNPPTKEDIKSGKLKDCRMAVFVGEGGIPPSKTTKTQPEATGEQEKASQQQPNVVAKTGLFGRPVELTASSPVADLVKALEKKGKKSGTDFDANAKPEALFALLKTL